MIHTVRNPFYCRRDQFLAAGFPGSVLVIGIDVHALSTQNPYSFRIGKNPRVYTGDSMDALKIAYRWKNKKGKLVAIVPVDFFVEKGYPGEDLFDNKMIDKLEIS